MTEYTLGSPPTMKIVMWITLAFDTFFNRPPFRHALGITALAVGLLNIVDMGDGLSSILRVVFDAPVWAIVLYMALTAFSGGVLLVWPNPSRLWYMPSVTYLLLTFSGYLIGATVGINTWAFALKALFSVGLAWWLLVRTLLRRDDE